MAAKRKIGGSIKDGGGLTRGKSLISKSENLGNLMRKYRDLADVLYPYVSNSDFVYEDMDFTIEEFADMTGSSIEDLLNDINTVIK